VRADTLRLDSAVVIARAAFLRGRRLPRDGGPTPEVSHRARSWYTTLHGWALAHDEVRLFNRAYRGQTNKPFMLSLAARCGLTVPATRISNDLDGPGARRRRRAHRKPVLGGGYCQPLPELLASTERRDGLAAAPAIVQDRLVARRCASSGSAAASSRSKSAPRRSTTRAASDTRVEPLPVSRLDPALLASLGALMAALDMEFAAADFKTSPVTGELVFPGDQLLPHVRRVRPRGRRHRDRRHAGLARGVETAPTPLVPRCPSPRNELGRGVRVLRLRLARERRFHTGSHCDCQCYWRR
jgi:hypothetical protein